MLIENRDIVIITIQPWYYELGSNCKNIALELAKHNRVLYVNIPITRKTFYSSDKTAGVQHHCTIIREKQNTIEQIDTNLWQFYPTTLIESINWLPSTGIFRFINRINNQRFANDIKKAISKVGFSNIILFNDNDIYNGFHLKELLRPSLYVYYMRDFLQGYAFWKKHSTVLEPMLIQKADLVVTNSFYYRDYCLNYNSNTQYIGQGCKLDLFDPEKEEPVPEAIKELKRPIIGYTGALDSSRLDHHIIRTIANARPQWQVVLVGPEDEAFRQSDLHQLQNVHFTGHQPITALPAFIRSFDVCINPQQVNPITSGNYPLKIDEYLAIGKPVVATYTKAMELFEDYVGLAHTAQDYPNLLEAALLQSKESTQKGIAFARSHTWQNSVEALFQAILNTEVISV